MSSRLEWSASGLILVLCAAVVGKGVAGARLQQQGAVVAWESDQTGQCTVPPPNVGFDGIAGGGYLGGGGGLKTIAAGHSLGLRGGVVAAWGNNTEGQCDVPPPNSGFAQVAAGLYHSLGLRSGAIVGWGDNSAGQCDVPPPNAGFVAVASGNAHSLGLKSGGSIVAWGYNGYGQCDVPPPNAGFVAIAGGLLTVADFGCFQTKFVAGCP